MEVREAKVDKDDPLLARLKSERLSISKLESVPAYVIFSDATLIEICKKRPKSMSEMNAISGVGAVKLEKYGARFLRIVQDFVDKQ